MCDLLLARGSDIKKVKYLVKKDVNIHAGEDLALRWGCEYKYLDVVKHLTEQGADIHADDDYALQLAYKHKYLDVVKYLVKK